MENRRPNWAEQMAIEEEAARLVILLGSDRTSPESRAALVWIDADPRHAVAFAIAQDAWRKSARVRLRQGNLFEKATQAADMPIPSLPVKPGFLTRRQTIITGLSAAALASVVGIGSAFRLLGQRHRTGHAERAVAQFADGSSIAMNGETAMDVDMQESRRLVHLLRGEALFDVARDPARPFIIDLNGARIEVLGTKFNVRKREGTVELSVIEGLVSVSSGKEFVKVPAGSTAIIRPGASVIAVKAPEVVQQRVAWSEGFLEFNNRPLEEIVEEFNRYRTSPIIIGDPRIGSTIITGRFGLTESDEFVAALESSFGIIAAKGLNGEVSLMQSDDATIYRRSKEE